MQYDYIKRVGWSNNSFYVSSMFLIEYQSHKNLMNIKDPILNVLYDPFDICSYGRDKLNEPIEIVNKIDYKSLIQLPDKSYMKLYNQKTLIEICLDKYTSETNVFLLEELIKMILHLSKYKYKRNPFYYAQTLKLNKTDKLYNVLKNTCAINLSISSSIKDINLKLVNHYIKNDSFKQLNDFLMYIGLPVTAVINKLILYNSQKIMKDLLEYNLLDEYHMYNLIFMSENIDFLKEFDVLTAINFLENIVTRGLYTSFCCLLDKDSSIINATFENDNNILHIIKPNKDYLKIITKVMEMNPNLINIYNNDGETPLLYHSKHNPTILGEFIKYDADLTLVDKNGNSCFHFICALNEPVILKLLIKQYPDFINLPNNTLDYPIMICCKNKQEEMFEILKCYANLDVKDSYGNTIYHYICANSICLGIMIKLIKNNFGLTPKDYCKLAHKFYIMK